MSRPEATLRLPSGYPVANPRHLGKPGLGYPIKQYLQATLKPPSGYPGVTAGLRVFPISRPFNLGGDNGFTGIFHTQKRRVGGTGPTVAGGASACWRVFYALTKRHSVPNPIRFRFDPD